MDSESQIALLLAQVDAGMRELEHTVENFELAVTQAEQCLAETETSLQTTGLHSETELFPLTRALQAGHDAASLVRAASTALDEALTQAETSVPANVSEAALAPLPAGTLICDGRYRLVQLLHSRPRVHLYLARRQACHAGRAADEQPLVAVRELLLAGLAPAVRQSLVRAAFEEFAAPQLFGTFHLPGVGDHLYLEDERHYLVMQPRQARGFAPMFAQPLSERPEDAPPLDIHTALHLGTRLCQTIARLHRLNLHLGELTPTMVLLDHSAGAPWAPLLLASWPPAPHFWPNQSKNTAQRTAEQLFPTLEPDLELSALTDRAFAAPEAFSGQRDSRSDIYALGALLYLLCTGSAPVSAPRRLLAAQAHPASPSEETNGRTGRRAKRVPTTPPPTSLDLTLISPRQLNPHISPLLEQILLRALALSPDERFASARDLAEALESLHMRTELPVTPLPIAPFPRAKASRLRRLLEWLKR